ncbi:MAG: DMT family transporter [Pseudomonadota bacterium]
MSVISKHWLDFAPVIFLCLWSGGYATAKLGLQYAEPLTFLAIRFASVVVIMLLLFFYLRPALPQTRAEWLHLAVVGFLLQSVYFGFSYLGFAAGVAAGTLALIMSLQPVLVGLIAPSWNAESVSWQRYCGLALGLVGVAIVIISRSGIEPPSFIGFGCALFALCGITVGSLWEKRYGVSQHPVVANLVGYTVGLLGIVPFVFLLETRAVVWTTELVAALAYLVIGNSVIAVGLLLAMIRAGEVSRVSALLYLVPPIAALIAWLLLGEVMPVLAWPGIAIAAAGVYIATRY